MGWMEGLLGGFEGRRREVADQELTLAREQNSRESSVFQALLASPDPETRALAATGLLTSAAGPQRKSGLRGWLGEMSQNPILGQIRGLIDQPVTETETIPAKLPSRNYTGQISEAPARSLAQVSSSPTTGGPLHTVGHAGPPGVTLQTSATTTPQPTTTTRQVPRQVFQTPEQAMLSGKRAAAQGDVEGEIAGLVTSGYTPEQARELIRAKYERAYRGGAGGGVQSIAGELPDGTTAFAVFDRTPGSPTYGQYVDPATDRPLAGFRPRTTTGGRAITDRESIARELYGKPAATLSPREMAVVNQRLIAFGGEKAEATTLGRGQGAARVPLSTDQRRQQQNTLTEQWNKATAVAKDVNAQGALMRSSLARYDADPIGASQGVLVTFQKILDPESVVRESEYARSPAGLALLDWLDGQIQKWSAGGAGVPKEILAQMVQTAETLITARNVASGLENTRQRIGGAATDAGVDPVLVFGPDAMSGTGLPAAPSGRIGSPPPGSAAAGPGPEWTMVNGVLHYKGKPY